MLYDLVIEKLFRNAKYISQKCLFKIRGEMNSNTHLFSYRFVFSLFFFIWFKKISAEFWI